MMLSGWVAKHLQEPRKESQVALLQVFEGYQWETFPTVVRHSKEGRFIPTSDHGQRNQQLHV